MDAYTKTPTNNLLKKKARSKYFTPKITKPLFQTIPQKSSNSQQECADFAFSAQSSLSNVRIARQRQEPAAGLPQVAA